MTAVAAIILAAGQSTRMGGQNKLLALWQGKTLLAHVATAADASICTKTIVVTGHQQELVADALGDFDVTIAHNEDFKSGMASSIKTGIQHADANGFEAAVILLGDMPQISTSMIDKIVGADDAIIVATCEGKRGNPVLWPKRYFADLMTLKSDSGARQIIDRFGDEIIEVELGMPARFDLDTPEAFAGDPG